MKKFLSLLLCLGLTGALCISALAAGSAEIVRAFVYEGTLYTYVSMDGMEKPVTKAEARLGGQTFSATDRLETVRQSGAPVTWLLLVDNSTSMPAFREETETFARALSQSGGENTRFILATFGDAFTVVGEDVAAGELAQQVEALPFDEDVTRLHTAIGQALDYFEELPRERNELRCMVILSDAVQYDPQGGVPYDQLLEWVEHSDVMLHSVGLGTDQEALDSLGKLASASGGLHQSVDAGTAEEAAGRLAERSSGLYVTGFDLSGYASQGGAEQVSVTFASDGELICRAETQVELPELTGEAEKPLDSQPPARLPEAPAGTPGGASPGAPAVQKGPPAGLIAGIAAAALAVIAAAAALLRKKKAAPPAPPAVPARQTGIYMRLELVQGALAGGQNQQELELTDELMIGSASACDIVLQDEDAAPRHARLFSREGAVYVEDLRAPGGTKVNGTEIQAAQRLRSGDEITIGGVGIRLKF